MWDRCEEDEWDGQWSEKVKGKGVVELGEVKERTPDTEVKEGTRMDERMESQIKKTSKLKKKYDMWNKRLRKKMLNKKIMKSHMSNIRQGN